MANNNYAGFNYSNSQYIVGPAAGTATYNNGSIAYPAVTNTTYTNAAAYQSSVIGTGNNGAFPSGSVSSTNYNYNYVNTEYGRTAALQSFDVSKTYYQQTAANYSVLSPPIVSKTHYSAPPVKNINSVGAKSIGKDKVGIINKSIPPPPTIAPITGSGAFTNYNAALYSAASIYMSQKQQGNTITNSKSNGTTGMDSGTTSNTSHWSSYRKSGSSGNSSRRSKNTSRPQQLHYCDVCKISCAGPQTYREHLEGQKHKKREASLKMQASAQTTSQNRGNSYHCELCDITCTGTDAYAAHVRGAKHQKVVKLHQKLGKPIPPDDPKKVAKINFVAETAVISESIEGGSANDTLIATNVKSIDKTGGQDEINVEIMENTDNIKPVGGEYIDEIKNDEGKILSFNCKLCDCKFNDPNAKEMHMKGRRHRLQYKRKVQPDLVVDFKPTLRQRRLAVARAQRALMQAHRNANGAFSGTHDGNSSGVVCGNYWEDQRRRTQYDEEYDFNWLPRNYGNHRFVGRIGKPAPSFFGIMPGVGNVRRPESSDDRHALARHADIYPNEEELQFIQRIVSHTERALKLVSDTLFEDNASVSLIKKEKEGAKDGLKDGRDNQMMSFQTETDSGNIRILKGVMRVGFLAKGLLLQGDKLVELVVLCAEKPTYGLLKRISEELPQKLNIVCGENVIDYKVIVEKEQSAVIVEDKDIRVQISLTSPLLRDPIECDRTVEETVESNQNENNEDANFLPREPCLRALAELRHAKWFQARATGLQSCVMIIRILRDLRKRVECWRAMPLWSMELLVEKVISSAGFPISPGDCLRRIMEALASGFLLVGPGLLDPCEKEPTDALHSLNQQERENITVSAQIFLRCIAFRQMYKVLGMEQLPIIRFPTRPWRLNRKRRRSSGKMSSIADNMKIITEDNASNEKILKKDMTE